MSQSSTPAKAAAAPASSSSSSAAASSVSALDRLGLELERALAEAEAQQPESDEEDQDEFEPKEHRSNRWAPVASSVSSASPSTRAASVAASSAPNARHRDTAVRPAAPLDDAPSVDPDEDPDAAAAYDPFNDSLLSGQAAADQAAVDAYEAAEEAKQQFDESQFDHAGLDEDGEPFDVTPHPRRLLLGEGTLTYSEARLHKYGDGDVFIATEYASQRTIETRLHGRRLPQRIAQIVAHADRRVYFDLDATRIDRDPRLHPRFPMLRRYSRIHFNLPYVPRSVEGTGDLVATFLLRARRLQIVGDRVYLGLVDKSDHYHIDSVYRIRSASAAAGYQLVHKKHLYHRFTHHGYEHTTSVGGTLTTNNDRFANEFIFEKRADCTGGRQHRQAKYDLGSGAGGGQRRLRRQFRLKSVCRARTACVFLGSMYKLCSLHCFFSSLSPQR